MGNFLGSLLQIFSVKILRKIVIELQIVYTYLEDRIFYQQGQELKMNKACPLCQFKCVADHILKAHMLRKHTSKGTIHELRKHLYSIKLNLTN